MRIQSSSDHFLVSLARGDDVVASITKACADRDVGHAWVQGMGAIEQVTVGAYSFESRTYVREDLPGGWELLSLNANFGWADGEPVLHPHVVISDMQNQVRGGHLFAAKVHVTLEVIVWTGAERLERVLNEDIGLKLWNLPEED